MRRPHPFLCIALVAGGLVLGSMASARGQGAESTFVRGDANVDGERDVSDAVYILLCSFRGTECSPCADAADVNDDGDINVADPVYLLNFFFVRGPWPPAPAEACGTDPSGDDLGCESYPRCADPDAIPTSRGNLVVVPIEHGSVVLLWDGKAIYADPVGGAAKYAAVPPPDLVVITHTHGDHMDANTLGGVAAESTVVVVPSSVASALSSSGVLDAVDARVLANGETTVVGDIEVEAVPMYNLTADRLRYHAKGTGNGYVLDLDGTRVYVSGDTEDIPEMRALPDIALAFVCMNLPFTMTPAQAASAVLEFAPRVVYPYHYRGQNPATFRSLVEAESSDIDVRLRNWYP